MKDINESRANGNIGQGQCLSADLKLPADVVQPDAYQLLGVERFEKDIQVIKTAAMNRNHLLQRMQNAENYEDVKRLEREVGAAMVCLSDPDKKADYDRRLAADNAPEISLTLPPEATVNVAGNNVPTVEIERPVEEPSGPELPPLPPAPDSGERKLPPPSTVWTKDDQRKPKQKVKRVGNLTQDSSASFLPGEIPWETPPSWWKARSPLQKGLIVGLPAVLALGLLIVVWPSSREAVPEEQQASAKTENRHSEPAPKPVVAVATVDPAPKTAPPAVVPQNNAEPVSVGNVKRLAATREFSRTAKQPAIFRPVPIGAAVIADDGLHFAASENNATVIFDARSGQSLHTLPVTLAFDHAARFSPDGKTLLTLVPAERKLKLWNVADGQLLQERDFVPPLVPALAVSPMAGRLILTGQSGKMEVHTNFQDISQPAATFQIAGECLNLALSPGGRYCASHLNGSVEIWDLGDPNAAPVPQRKTSYDFFAVELTSFALSADGETIAAGMPDERVHIYDSDGRERVSFQAHEGPTKALEFAPNGLLLTAGDDEVRIWDANTWFPLARLRTAPAAGMVNPQSMSPFPGGGMSPANAGRFGSGSVNAGPPVAFRLTSDRKQIVVIHASGQGRVWEVSEKENPAVDVAGLVPNWKFAGPPRVLSATNAAGLAKWIECPAHDAACTAAAFSRDGKYVVTLGRDAALRFWESRTGDLHHVVNVAPAEEWNLRGLAVSPTGDVLAAPADGGRMIQLWDIAKGGNLGPIAAKAPAPYAWCDFSPDGKTLLTLTETGKLQCWNVETRQEDKAQAGRNPAANVTAAAVPLRSEKYDVALGMPTGGIWLWSLTTGSKTSLSAEASAVARLKFSRDGEFLAAAYESGKIIVWDLESAQKISEHALSPASDLIFTPDSQSMLVLTGDRKLHLLPARAGAIPKPAKETQGNHLALSPDGTLLVSAGAGGRWSFGAWAKNRIC